MILTEKIFGKSLYDITKDDFNLFFQTEREESSVLEFKSGEISIDDLYKEVCAFLNSEGGLILVGTPREKKVKTSNKNYKRVCVGQPVPSHLRNKGWIIQKFAANIIPFPTNIEIQEISTPEGKYFIIEVPQSINPPHQCQNDGRYYIRLEEEAKPAPHGIIQALFFKRQKPKIHTYTELYSLKGKPENELEININILNESDYPTENISFIINLYDIENAIAEEKHKNSRYFTINKDGKFIAINGEAKTVLLKKISFPIEFRVIHNFHPFIIGVFIWGMDFGIYEDMYIWDPVNRKEIKRIKSGENEHLNFDDLIKELEQIKKNTL